MLKYYVLNYDHNKREVVNFNIFDNWVLEEETIKTVKKYLRGPNNFKVRNPKKREEYIYGFEALVEELRGLIMWQEWSRFEYEIVVNGLLTDGEGEKWDCYRQCLPNMPMIAREVIYQYKENLKNQTKEEKDGD